jgi:hypothetical protein
MDARDRIDYKAVKTARDLMQKAFGAAMAKISRLTSSDIEDVELINSIIKTEFENNSILLSDAVYESAKSQYYNAIRTQQMMATRLGQKVSYKFNATDKTMLDIFDDGGSLFVTQMYDNILQGKVVDELKKMVSEGKSLKDTKNDIADLIGLTGKKALSNLSSYVVTNNTWTRSIATTNLLERAGARAYKYIVVLDAVTTDICRALAGKELAIDKAITLRDDYITIPRNDYDTFKAGVEQVSPLISYDEKNGVFYKQSQAGNPYKQIWTKDDILSIPGIELPPLHINCRTEIGIVY